MDVADIHEFFKDWSEEVKSWLDLSLWIISLDSCGNDCNEKTFSANCMSMGHHGDIHVRVSLELFLREDNLDRG